VISFVVRFVFVVFVACWLLVRAAQIMLLPAAYMIILHQVLRV
jgi:hypothetical protein